MRCRWLKNCRCSLKPSPTEQRTRAETSQNTGNFFSFSLLILILTRHYSDYGGQASRSKRHGHYLKLQCTEMIHHYGFQILLTSADRILSTVVATDHSSLLRRGTHGNGANLAVEWSAPALMMQTEAKPRLRPYWPC
jgi:hypothetical protein